MPKHCVRGGWHLERELRQNVWVVKLQYVNRNCSPMCIFGKRMAAGFSFNCRKQDGSWLYQPWRVGTGQELWLWWTINECCMWMKRRALWPHDLSPPLPSRNSRSRPHDPQQGAWQRPFVEKKQTFLRFIICCLCIGESGKNMSKSHSTPK